MKLIYGIIWVLAGVVLLPLSLLLIVLTAALWLPFVIVLIPMYEIFKLSGEKLDGTSKI